MSVLEKLDARIAQLEKEGRWREVVQALEERAELAEGAERVETLLRLMRLHRDRFSNPHFAMVAAERVLLLERHPDAIAYLRTAYTLRRMFEKLSELDDVARGPYR